MAKYSTGMSCKHRRAKEELKDAYDEILESYRVRSENGIEFEFELSRELKDEEWHKMPNMLIIHNSEDGVFEGQFKPHI